MTDAVMMLPYLQVVYWHRDTYYHDVIYNS